MSIVNDNGNLQMLNLPRLAALVYDPPDTQAAIVRLAWPRIKSALVAGHTLKTVHKRLREDGLEIGYRTLTRTVQRLRLQENRTPVPSPSSQRAPVLTPLNSPRQGDPMAAAMAALSKPRYDIRKAMCDGDPTGKDLI